jgi:hypothetical protein
MKCPKCQAEILDDSQFCSKCGTPIHPGDKVFLSHTHTILRPIDELVTDELVPGTELAGKYKIIDVVGLASFTKLRIKGLNEMSRSSFCPQS